MESPEDIQAVLAAAGETLVFPTFSIKGIPGSIVYTVSSGDSVYSIEKQELDFQIALSDFTLHNIKEKDTFIYSLNSSNIDFRIDSFVSDFIGWVRLIVALI